MAAHSLQDILNRFEHALLVGIKQPEVQPIIKKYYVPYWCYILAEIDAGRLDSHGGEDFAEFSLRNGMKSIVGELIELYILMYYTEIGYVVERATTWEEQRQGIDLWVSKAASRLSISCKFRDLDVTDGKLVDWVRLRDGDFLVLPESNCIDRIVYADYRNNYVLVAKYSELYRLHNEHHVTIDGGIRINNYTFVAADIIMENPNTALLANMDSLLCLQS